MTYRINGCPPYPPPTPGHPQQYYPPACLLCVCDEMQSCFSSAGQQVIRDRLLLCRDAQLLKVHSLKSLVRRLSHCELDFWKKGMEESSGKLKMVVSYGMMSSTETSLLSLRRRLGRTRQELKMLKIWQEQTGFEGSRSEEGVCWQSWMIFYIFWETVEDGAARRKIEIQERKFMAQQS